jgi:hypothetical protein
VYVYGMGRMEAWAEGMMPRAIATNPYRPRVQRSGSCKPEVDTPSPSELDTEPERR